jgi:hypothetical protein
MATVEDEVPTEEQDAEARIDRFQAVYGHPAEADLDELAKWVDDSYHEQDNGMFSRFHQWSYNIQFAGGRQWLHSTDGRFWHEPPIPAGSVRVTNNLTWRAGEYRLAKLTESRPLGKIIPHSNEVSDADKAEAGQQVVQHLDRVLDMGRNYEESLWYDWLCGCAFGLVGWNAETGEFVVARQAREIVNPETGMADVEEFFVNADGQEVSSDSAYNYRTGEPDYTVLPPWSVRVGDPQQTDHGKQRKFWVHEVAEVSDVKRRYGGKADHVGGGDEFDHFVTHEDLISGWSHDSARRRPMDRQFVPRASVVHYFEEKSSEYPKGRYIVVCERKVLHIGPLPYGNDEIGYRIPIVQIRTSHKPKDYYGFAGIEPLIPIQKRINQLESHATEYIRLFSRGGITAEMGTLIEESWNDNYGSVLYYQGKQPSPLSWPGMPSDVWQALNRAYENFDRISGWADVARGDVPPGVKAARAILELKRSNDTPLGKALQRFDRFVEEVTQKLLERAKWGYSEEHWIQVLGSDVPHMVKSVTSDSLPSRFTVRIESDSMLRLSYPAKLELLFELADRGWIDKDSAMRLLNFGDWEHQSGQWNRDYGRARGKIEKLLMGQPVTVEWWEHDPVHMLAIAERLKDPRFDLYPPEQQSLLSQLWVAHYKQWMMKQSGQLPPEMGLGNQGPSPEGAMQKGKPPQQLAQQAPPPGGAKPPNFAGAEPMTNPGETMQGPHAQFKN